MDWGGGWRLVDPTLVSESKTDKIPIEGGCGGGVLLTQLLFLSLKVTKSQSPILMVRGGGGSVDPTFVSKSKTDKIPKPHIEVGAILTQPLFLNPKTGQYSHSPHTDRGGG